MERLTERYPGAVAYIGRYSRRVPGFPDLAETMKVAGTRDVLQRLAEYEDTGMEPEQVKTMAKDHPTEPCALCTPNRYDKSNNLYTVETETGWTVLHSKTIFYCCACGRKL